MGMFKIRWRSPHQSTVPKTTPKYHTKLPHQSTTPKYPGTIPSLKIDFDKILGLINPNAKSPKSKASQTILGLLNPQQKQARRTTLDTTWMTNTSPNKALVYDMWVFYANIHIEPCKRVWRNCSKMHLLQIRPNSIRKIDVQLWIRLGLLTIRKIDQPNHQITKRVNNYQIFLEFRFNSNHSIIFLILRPDFVRKIWQDSKWAPNKICRVEKA